MLRVYSDLTPEDIWLHAKTVVHVYKFISDTALVEALHVELRYTPEHQIRSF